MVRLDRTNALELNMTKLPAPAVPVSATETKIDPSFVFVSIFAGIGLLISLALLILDQNLPGDWF